jgi:hypothetical protein
MLDERKTREQPHIRTFEEQTKVIAVATPHLRCLIALLVDTTLESAKLTWKDVDFEKSQIVVRESKKLWLVGELFHFQISVRRNCSVGAG